MTLANTLMQSLRTRYSAKYDENERRRSRYGALELFQRQEADASSLVTPEIRAVIAASEGNSIEIPVLDAQDVTLSNVRSCTVADSENESNLTTVTFATLAFGFTMTPMQHGNNDISYQRDFDVKMEKYLLKAASHMDSLSVDHLNTVKNQVWPAEVLNVYAQVGNALQVPQSEKNDFYNQLSAIMQNMDFYNDRYDVLANTMHQAALNRLRAQGSSNDENENFQFGPYDYAFSNRVTSRAGVEATLFAVAPGSVAMLNRNDITARSHRKLKNGKEFGETYLPLINQTWGTYYLEDCADRSALHAGTAHLTRTVLEGFEFSTDIVFMSKYNSDPTTRHNPIVKAEIWVGDSAPV